MNLLLSSSYTNAVQIEGTIKLLINGKIDSTVLLWSSMSYVYRLGDYSPG